MLQRSGRAAGLVLPAVTGQSPPSGPGWLHEIKHDGFRILALRDAKGRAAKRFLLVVASVMAMPMRSRLIDG